VALEEGGVHDLLIAALGCSMAWGIIDAVLYLMNQASERGRRFRIGQAIRKAADREVALDAIRGELDEDLDPLASDAAREQLYADILERVRNAAPRTTGLTREDLLGALATFCLVFLVALPAVAPFVFLSDPFVSLRISNAILLGLMFTAGWRWAGYTGGSRIGTASGMLLLGLVLVLVAIALGG
jgi:VIT1/CCC1 family predicted Fe2+/Mn2+ transporter